MAMGNYPAFSIAALYVGDLHPEVTEATLYEKFATVGPILSLHVCRDMVTRRSLGYAYVNYQSVVDAERALDTMNFDLVKGRPIRIMWSQRDPSLRKSGIGNVFIKNLDKSIDTKELYDTFAAFGGILSCKVVQDDDGNSKGYGFVHFETRESADKAIQKVDGMLLRGKKVYVGKFIPRQERQRMLGEKQRLFTNVFVKNFGDELDDEKLRTMFSAFGVITSCKVMRSEDGSSKGFGFVAYENPAAAEAAVRELNSRELPNGMVLYVGRAQKRAERQMELRDRYNQMRAERFALSQCTNLFVKNLDESVDDDRLRREFERLGTVTSAKVMTDNGRSKGFGFVSFATPEEATRVITEMNGRLLVSKPLYVALAQRKEDRKAFLAAQHAHHLVHLRSQHITYSALQPPGPFYMPPARLLPLAALPRAPLPRWNIPPQIRAAPLPHLRPPFAVRPMRPRAVVPSIAAAAAAAVAAPGPSPRHNEVAVMPPALPASILQEPEDSKPSDEPDKQALEERLLLIVHKFQPENASEIADTLLELEPSEIERLLVNETELKNKIDQVASIIQARL